MKSTEYTCPRCGYKSYRRSSICRHLFQRTKTCPAIKNDIVLTDDIKKYVLENRIYKIEKPKPKTTINQTINNYNTLNAFIANMSPIDKIEEITKYYKKEIVPFERKVELMYEEDRRNVEKNVGMYDFREEDYINMIDRVTKVTNSKYEESNVLLDQNKLFIREHDDWKEFIYNYGLKIIVNMIKEYYWNAYECYLIRRIKNDAIQCQTRMKTKESLIEYYKFIGCLDIEPFIKDNHNNTVHFVADDDEYWQVPQDMAGFSLSEEFFKLYQKTKDDLSIKQKEKVQQSLIGVLKTNTKHNIKELNKSIMRVMNFDAEFQSRVAGCIIENKEEI